MVRNPLFRSHLSHLEGVPQPYLGDFRSPWLLTTYKSWDDPPSNSAHQFRKTTVRPETPVPHFGRSGRSWSVESLKGKTPSQKITERIEFEGVSHSGEVEFLVKGWEMGYNLLTNETYWGYNTLIRILTFYPNFQRDILVVGSTPNPFDFTHTPCPLSTIKLC